MRFAAPFALLLAVLAGPSAPASAGEPRLEGMYSLTGLNPGGVGIARGGMLAVSFYGQDTTGVVAPSPLQFPAILAPQNISTHGSSFGTNVAPSTAESHGSGRRWV